MTPLLLIIVTFATWAYVKNRTKEKIPGDIKFVNEKGLIKWAIVLLIIKLLWSWVRGILEDKFFLGDLTVVAWTFIILLIPTLFLYNRVLAGGKVKPLPMLGPLFFSLSMAIGLGLILDYQKHNNAFDGKTGKPRWKISEHSADQRLYPNEKDSVYSVKTGAPLREVATTDTIYEKSSLSNVEVLAKGMLSYPRRQEEPPKESIKVVREIPTGAAAEFSFIVPLKGESEIQSIPRNRKFELTYPGVNNCTIRYTTNDGFVFYGGMKDGLRFGDRLDGADLTLFWGELQEGETTPTVVVQYR